MEFELSVVFSFFFFFYRKVLSTKIFSCSFNPTSQFVYLAANSLWPLLNIFSPLPKPDVNHFFCLPSSNLRSFFVLFFRSHLGPINRRFFFRTVVSPFFRGKTERKKTMNSGIPFIFRFSCLVSLGTQWGYRACALRELFEVGQHTLGH